MDAGPRLEETKAIVSRCPSAFLQNVANGMQSLQETSMEAIHHDDEITADCLVDQVIRRHPQTIAIFTSHGLQCVGCLISPYHTIADSAREYQVRVGPLLGELNRSLTVDRNS